MAVDGDIYDITGCLKYRGKYAEVFMFLAFAFMILITYIILATLFFLSLVFRGFNLEMR